MICMFFVQFPAVTVRAEGVPDELSELYARSAVLMDADSGRILFGKKEDQVLPMASTTKIMTCIVTLEQMSEGQMADVSDYAACQPKVRLGVRGGEKYRIKDLLYSLMLESHNDSAVVIAENIGGSVEGFASLMNQKAEKLGCRQTHFVTPNGLDGEDEGGVHATTAEELATIMRYCIMESPQKETFLEITRTMDYSFTNAEGSRIFSCHNHNAFLGMMEGALSGKTGFTADAGYCYVGALRRGRRTFIVALLACGWPNNKGYKWKDTRKLMEYGLANYEYREVEQTSELGDITVTDGVEKSNPCVRDSSVKMVVDDAEKTESEGGQQKTMKALLREDEKVKVRKDLPETIQAPVQAGDKIGTVSYYIDDMKLRSYDVVAAGKVKKRTYAWCFSWVVKMLCL